MVSVTKRFCFDAAHRLLDHDGQCKFLHGHGYVAEVEISGPLNDKGMVIDFGELKETIGDWIKKNWDHNTILKAGDPLIAWVEENQNKRPYVMTGNPTAENMARELLWKSNQLVPLDCSVVRVRIWESENSFAEVRN